MSDAIRETFRQSLIVRLFVSLFVCLVFRLLFLPSLWLLLVPFLVVLMLDLIDKYFLHSRHQWMIYVPTYACLLVFVVIPQFSQGARSLLPEYVQSLYGGVSTNLGFQTYTMNAAIEDKQRILGQLNQFNAIRKKRPLTKLEEKQEEDLVLQLRGVEERIDKLKRMKESGQSEPSPELTQPSMVSAVNSTSPSNSPGSTPSIAVASGNGRIEGASTGTSSDSARPSLSSTGLSPTAEVQNTESATSSPATLPKAPISGGVLNGKATSLPPPTYPASAMSARVSGPVVVQVLIDENGNVLSAHATSGPSLLQPAAVEAARAAKFSPTKISGQSVKVNGVITYNFVLP